MSTAPDDPVLLLGLGDAHGDFAPLFAAARQEPAARVILQVGDLTAGKLGRESRPDDDPGTLASLPHPLVWVHGNHERWERLGLVDAAEVPVAQDTTTGAALRALPPRPQLPHYHLQAGEAYVVPGTDIRVVGLPGNYAPTWYEREKPFPGDRVRHFNAADVMALERFHRPAVLLMHEAFRGQAPGRIGLMGVPVLTPLIRRLQPAVCLTGHHHTFAAAEHGPTLALAMPRAQDGYVRLWFTPHGERLSWELVPFDAD